MIDYTIPIRDFFSRFFRVDEVGGDDDIFARALVNSLFAMQLILWIESEFGVEVGDEDLRLANFNSVNAIAAFITRKVALPVSG